MYPHLLALSWGLEKDSAILVLLIVEHCLKNRELNRQALSHCRCHLVWNPIGLGFPLGRSSRMPVPDSADLETSARHFVGCLPMTRLRIEIHFPEKVAIVDPLAIS